MREEHVLVGSHLSGAQRVSDDRGSTSTVEEVKRDGCAVAVGRLEGAVEIRKEVDGFAVVDAWGEDTGDGDL